MHGQYEQILLFSVLTFWFRSILHDPKVFNNPMEFQPERYLKDGKLNPDVRDPLCAAFGFGRRSVNRSNIFYEVYLMEPFPSICPGRYLGDNMLYLIASSLLAVFDIKPPADDHGAPIELKPEFTSTLLS